MKTLYLLLALSPIAMFAQTFTYDDTPNVDQVIPSETYTNVDMYFTTPAPEGIEFHWKLISNDFPTGWNYSLCDYTSCYAGIPDDGMMTPISLSEATGGTKGFFKITIDPGVIYGTGTAVLYVYDAADTLRGDTVSFKLTNLNTVGFEEDELSVGVYPNPATDFVSITNKGNSTVNFELFDITGSQIQGGTVAQGAKTNLSVATLPKGMYFLKMSSATGIKRTEKIIVR